jgi:iron(III) transport system ATP-binding protein
MVAIRPDALLLAWDKPRHPALPGHITKSANLGTHMEYTVECALGCLFVVDRATADPYPIGAEVWVAFAKSGITVVRR